MRWDAFVVTCALAAAGAARAGDMTASVQAKLLTDGRWAVYKGAANGADLELLGTNDPPSAADFLPVPQQCRFELEDQRYIYVVVWGTPPTDGGVLAEFLFNGIAVLSGDSTWEVCLPPLRLEPDDPPPSTSAVGSQIRRASRLFVWQKAALVGANGFGPAGVVRGISERAAWMWSPVDVNGWRPGPLAARSGQVLIFRINPNELWPEIELWHERNVGVGPEIGGAISGDGYYRSGAGSAGAGGGSGVPAMGGTGAVRGVPDPFSNFEPPGATSRVASATESGRSSPRLPPSPVLSSTDDKQPPANPPEPPVVPEPSAALLALLCAGWIRPRR